MTTYTWTDNAMRGGSACDVDKVADNLMHLKYDNIPAMSTLFALNSGNVDSSGNADLLFYSGTTLSFKVDTNVSYKPLALTYADKSQETLTALSNITGLSVDGIYTIIKEKGSNLVAVLTSGILGGTAISSGDLDPSLFCGTSTSASNVFDGLFSTLWASSHIQTNVQGNAYIGKNFGISRTINTLRFRQGSDSQSVSSVKLQSSTNGQNWTDVQTFNNLNSGDNLLILNTPLMTGQYRLLANSGFINPTGSYSWIVFELTANQNAVTQGKIFPSKPIDGDYHCLTATDLKTYKRVGGAWIEIQFVRLGTATVSGGVITSCTTNLYNQNGYNVNFQTQGYRSPDYSNPINKTWSTMYQAECDGFIRVMAYYQSSSYPKFARGLAPIEVTNALGAANSVPTDTNLLYCGGNAASGQFGIGWAKVSKGDFYKADYGTAVSLVFYPAKGAN